MPSWNIPALINKISEDVPAIKGLLTALFKWTDADTTDVPVGAKRLQDVAGGKQMQEYSGSAWASIGKLMHDVDMLDGKHASTAQTADTIPVRDANGTIPGNISGNAATATSAYGLDSGYTVPVANGGTGATTEAGARASLGADNASNIASGILDIAYGGTGSSTKNFVDLTENQNVGGTKTFSSEIKSTAGTLLSTVMTGVSVADTTRGQRSTKNIGAVYDKDGVRLASIEAEAHTDGSQSIYFILRNHANSGWFYPLKVKVLADNTAVTETQTPSAAANDTQIATTAWVRSATGNTSLNAATATKVVATVADDATGELVRGTMGTNDAFRIAVGGANNAGWAEIATADDYNEPIYVRQYQGNFATLKRTVTLLDASGNSSFPGTITATFKGNITGNVTGNCSGSSGSCTGNAATATKATQDSAGNNINTTYIKALSVSGKTITYTKGNGTTGTITTQDTNTTYSNFVKSGSSAAAGLVPKPSTTAGTTKYLREDCSWQVPPNTVYTHPTTAGNKHIPSGGSSGQFLGWSADGAAKWVNNPNTNTTYSNFTAATSSAAGKAGLVPAPPKLNAINSAVVYLSNAGWRYDASLSGTSLSDKRLKQDFNELPIELLDAWHEINWCQFRYIKDVKTYKENALINTGLVVQDLQSIFDKHNIDYGKYNITSHFVCESVPEEKDEDGNVVCEAQSAVDQWHMNYIQAFAIEAAYQRRRASRAEARIAVLEERLAKMESKLN